MKRKTKSRRSGRRLIAVGQTMLVAAVLFGARPSRAEERALSDESLPSDRYIALRAGLPNCRVRFAVEKTGRVAFLGGSITHMSNGWRSMVGGLLQKRFPETRFDFIDAGIPSTDTAYGPFRLDRDVFARGRVDLLFVEFAVNDQTNGRTATESIRGMEGIVRQARRANPAIDIVMLHFVDPDKMAMIRKGRRPPVIASHEKVAGHYGVPSIDLAREVTERIDAGEFDWKAFGDLHPARFGHEVYARSIDRLFDLAWAKPLPTGARVQPPRMPDGPVDALNYERARLVRLEEARVVGGWQRVARWTAKDAATREGFCNVPMLVARQPGATLKLAFTGTAVGLVVAAGPDVGILEFAIDGGDVRWVDQYTQWSHALHIPWVYMLDADLTPGRHELVLRTANAKHPKSKGHACRIVQFVAN